VLHRILGPVSPYLDTLSTQKPLPSLCCTIMIRAERGEREESRRTTQNFSNDQDTTTAAS
jgi:hypothetical protein